MLSKYIGIVYEEKTKEIRSIINPDKDEQLDDPAFVTNPNETLKMLKIERNNLPQPMTLSQCAFISDYVKEKLL